MLNWAAIVIATHRLDTCGSMLTDGSEIGGTKNNNGAKNIFGSIPLGKDEHIPRHIDVLADKNPSLRLSERKSNEGVQME